MNITLAVRFSKYPTKKNHYIVSFDSVPNIPHKKNAARN